MKDKIHIRKATEEDFEAIFLIMIELLIKHMTKEKMLKLKGSSKKKFLEIINGKASNFFVAELEGEIIGMLSGGPPLALWNIPERKTFIIEEMAVSSELRSKGVGGKLIKHLENYARKQGYKKIAASSNISRERAHQFYIKNNFQKDEFRFSKKI